MPSHKVHRWCAESLGIPGEVANFVDRLIDLGCETHDVGVRHPAVDMGWAKMPTASGAEVLLGCLAMQNKLDDAHLRAAALHLLLDCVDVMIKNYGTAVAEDSFETERVLDRCISKVADRLRDVDMYLLPSDRARAMQVAQKLIIPLYDISNRHRDVLRRCVALIVEENASKGVEPFGAYPYYEPLKAALTLCGEMYHWIKQSDYSRLYRLAKKLAQKKVNTYALAEAIMKSGACISRDRFFAVIEKAAKI